MGCVVSDLYCSIIIWFWFWFIRFWFRLGMLGFCWNLDFCFFSQVMLLLDRMGCVVSDLYCSIIIWFWFRLLCCWLDLLHCFLSQVLTYCCCWSLDMCPTCCKDCIPPCRRSLVTFCC